MATKKAKERAERALVRAGREAQNIIAAHDAARVKAEIERDRLQAQLVSAFQGQRSADERIEDLERRIADRDLQIRRFSSELSYERTQLRALKGEQHHLLIQAELTQALLADATKELERRAGVAKKADEHAAENKKLRRRVAELKSEMARSTSLFHRVCQKLARYNRDESRAFFAEAQGLAKDAIRSGLRADAEVGAENR